MRCMNYSTPSMLGVKIHVMSFHHQKDMQRWWFCSLAQCPRCTAHLRDKAHILTCPDPLAHKLWDKSLLETVGDLAQAQRHRYHHTRPIHELPIIPPNGATQLEVR